MKTCLLVLILGCCLTAKAQDLLAPAGDVSAGELEYTLGEWAVSLFPACETGFLVYGNYDFVLTDIRPLPEPDDDIKILNRPASRTLMLYTGDLPAPANVRFTVYSSTGILYKNGIVDQTPYVISYETFPPGFYLLRIIRESGMPVMYEWIKK